jgi:medium-chain acyl-[acyl-carrier-protein] hydrolase
VRLVCLPFAGGGAGAFRTWADALPLTVEVCAVQPPGRETRFREPPYARLAPLVAALADVLPPLFDVPVVLYGHSLGALAAFELARELRRRGGPVPAQLIVSGRVAPDVPPRPRPLHTLPGAEFRAELRRLNGTPAAVLDNDELMAAFLPVLRADFAAHETYEYREEPPLDCPILAVTGAADTLAPPDQLDGWRRHTRAAFEARVLPGDHFFLQTQRAALLQLLTRVLEPIT